MLPFFAQKPHHLQIDTSKKLLPLQAMYFYSLFLLFVMATTSKTTTTTRQPQRGLTFDDVWAALMKTHEGLDKLKEQSQETDRRMQKQMQENDRRMKEQMQESERIMKEYMQENVRQMKEQIKETNKIIGRLGSRLGDVVEWLMTPNLHSKFRDIGYTFSSTCRNKEFRNEQRQILAEVDAFLENGIYAMAVEVKTNLGADDIKEHVERMETIRHYADAHGDKRKFLGAVAAPNVENSVRKAAYRAGFFVIEPSADAVEILIPDGFKPKEW
jgi:DNA repair exonuclease SbcCD ATPase subunit